MIARQDQANSFLTNARWDAALRAPLAGDASNRRYERLTRPDGTRAVLMDAPPEKGEDVRPFVTIARHLTNLGLSAPQILAEDRTHGFLLLEDLGDALFARVLQQDATKEEPLYQAATDVLIDLHQHAPPPDLPPYDAETMASLAALAFDWYAKGAVGHDVPQASFIPAMHDAMADNAPLTKPALILRDYHAENLLWLPERTGIARVGLLDFQDARAGHPAYDLVSLLEDARRDVTEATRQASLRHYLDRTGTDEGAFNAAFCTLGAQRNLRILGVFARLSLRDGKRHYVDLIPRVWAHLQRDLSHPALTDLARKTEALPPPTPAILGKLKDLCGTIPTP